MGWDDVWDTHKLIATTLTSMSTSNRSLQPFADTDLPLVDFVNYGDKIAIEYIEQARATAKTFFQNMDQDMKNAILPKSMQAETPASAAVPPSGPDLNTPQSNFVLYHLNNTAATPSQDDAANGNASNLQAKASVTNGSQVKGMPNGTTANKKTGSLHSKVSMADSNTAPDHKTSPGAIALDVLEQFATDIIEPLGKTLMDKLGTDVDALLDLIKHGSMDKLWTLIADAADTVISVIAEFVDGFLHFCEDIVNDLKDFITQPLEIPFFTELYEFVCQLMGYDEEFTLINAMSFLVSIPLTTMMKIGGYGTIMDHNDIVKMDDPNLPQQLVSTVQGALQSPRAPTPHTQSKMVKSKALLTTHSLAATTDEGEHDDGFKPSFGLQITSGVFGVCNAVAAIMYNGLDLDFLADRESATWKKNIKIALAVARTAFSAPMPKANVDAQAYEIRWLAWIIGNGWRIFTIFLKPDINPMVQGVVLPRFFENGGSLGVNVTSEVLAVVCDARDKVTGLTWAGDIVSNSGSAVSSLGKIVEKDLQKEAPGKAIKFAGTLVAIGGNLVSFVNAGGSIVNSADGGEVWTGIL